MGSLVLEGYLRCCLDCYSHRPDDRLPCRQLCQPRSGEGLPPPSTRTHDRRRLLPSQLPLQLPPFPNRNDPLPPLATYRSLFPRPPTLRKPLPARRRNGRKLPPA